MKWDDMLRHVLPSATGCPDTLALDHLVRAARMFCARTLAWNYETTPTDSAAGVARYTLQMGQGQELVRLLAVEFNGQAYDVPPGPKGRAMQRSGSGYTAVLEGNNDFVLNPAPYLDGKQIITEIAVKPALDSPALWPDDLEEHVEALADGALATLLRLPDKTWTNSQAADDAQGRFQDRISTVAFKVTKGFGRSRHGAAIRWF